MGSAGPPSTSTTSSLHRRLEGLAGSLSTISDERLLERVLYLLKTRPDLDACHLLTEQDATLKQFSTILKFMQERSWCDLSNGKVVLTDKSREALPVQMQKAIEELSFRCSECKGKGVALGPNSNFDAIEKWRAMEKGRPSIREEWDQWPMNAESAFGRVHFFHQRGDLVDKRLLFVGDDDLVGIAAALTELPREVVVLEGDERLVEYINKVSKDYNLRLTAETYDIRAPFPEKYRKHFDVFVCDPVETLLGIKLFINRGSAGLKGLGGSGYFGLTTLEASAKKWFDVQKILSSMSFSVTDIMRNYTDYPDPGWEEKLTIWKTLQTKPTCIWYRSALWRLEIVDELKLVIQPNEQFTDKEDLYLDEDAWATTGHKTDVVTDI